MTSPVPAFRDPAPAAAAPMGGAASGNYPLAVGLALVAVGCIAASDGFAKALSSAYDTAAIVLYRATVGGAILGVALARARLAAPGGPLVAAPALQLLRGLLVTGAAFLFFWGLARTPLANAIALTALAPVFMAAMGRALLGERPSPWLWPLIALSAAGVALIGGPAEAGGSWTAHGAVIVSALLYALVCVLTRVIAGRDRAETTAFASYAVMATVAALAGVATGVRLPAVEHLPLILGLGASGALGMAAYARAYVHAGVADLAPWDNAVFLWGLGIGAVAFGETPGTPALAGGALVAASGVLAARLARR
jgi:S-adenosylmethionine uptake transporter